MAASIVGLDGRKREGPDPLESKDAVIALRALADLLEKGEKYGPLEDWAFIFRTTSKDDPGCVVTEIADSGVTIAQLVYMLEATKLDVMQAARDYAT